MQHNWASLFKESVSWKQDIASWESASPYSAHTWYAMLTDGGEETQWYKIRL